jgi:putative oxidoreductase
VNIIENTLLLVGRVLLGLYFILPGIMKLANFEGTSTYMAEHNVPFIAALLALTILLQLSGGVALIVGYKGKLTAFMLAGLTLVISFYMHNFWDYAEQGAQALARAHEQQNFAKNMGIMAGLLVIAGNGTGRFSIGERDKS